MRVHSMQVVDVPVGSIQQHPDNVNNGDVDALEESIDINGFYDPIKVQRSTGYIVAGNHRYLVALKKNQKTIPAIYLDLDDQQAKRIMLADNAITRRGFDDEPMLLNMLNELFATDMALHGTGYDTHDLRKLEASLEEPFDLPTDPVDDEKLDRHDGPNRALRFSILPVVESDGVVYELTVQREGMGPISRIDANAVRKALGLQPYSKQEVKSFGAMQWE